MENRSVVVSYLFEKKDTILEKEAGCLNISFRALLSQTDLADMRNLFHCFLGSPGLKGLFQL